MTVAVRVIPCLDVDAGRVVKGINFLDLRDAGDPVELAAAYDAGRRGRADLPRRHGVLDDRGTMLDVVRRTAESVFIPLTVGGGVRQVADVDTLLRAGADKVGVNTAAIARPELIAEIADRFGRQVLVLSLDVRRAPTGGTPSGFEVTTHGGRRGTGIDAVRWAQRGAELGAGEILLNSMDADGTKAGFDLELIAAVRAVVDVPVVASGGAGAVAHFPPAIARRRRRGARRQRLPLRRADRRRGQGRAAPRRPSGALSRSALAGVPLRRPTGRRESNGPRIPGRRRRGRPRPGSSRRCRGRAGGSARPARCPPWSPTPAARPGAPQLLTARR